MVDTHLEMRWGDRVKNPGLDDMRAALAELSTPDPEHPDCWLSDADGWSVSAHEGGSVVLENVESGEGPWHIANVTQDTVVDLWLALQAGNLDTIRQYEWVEGYG